MKIENWSLTSKISWSYILCFLCIVFLEIFVVRREKNESYTAEKNRLNNLIESIHCITEHYHNLETSGALTKEKAQEMAFTQIKAIRYEKSNYFWIQNFTTMLMHPLKPELVGQNILGIKDPNGKALFVEMVELVKKDSEGFVDYIWAKPGFDKPQPKLSYVKGFKPWGWIIGTGVYIDDVDAKLIKNIYLALAFLIFVFVLLLCLSLLTHLKIGKPLKKLAIAIDEVTDQKVNVMLPQYQRNGFLGKLISFVEIAKINQSVHELYGTSLESLRMQFGLQTVNGSIMLVNPDKLITYINPRCKELFDEYFEEFSKIISLPKNLENNNIALLNPLNNGDIIKDGETSSATIQCGQIHLWYQVQPIYNSSQEHLGFVIEWRDLTDEIQIQKDVNDLVQAALEGDLSKRIDTRKLDSFMLSLSTSMNQLFETISDNISQLAKLMSAWASGDLTYKINQEFKGVFEDLRKDAILASSNTNGILKKIIIAGESIAEAAEEIDEGSNDLSKRTEDQAKQLESTSSAMTQLTSSVEQNSKNAQLADDFAKNAQTIGNKGSETVQEVVDAMQRIADSSAQINSIVGLIDEISFQTNLLALNASVEAARAGEAGRGFSIVANEVRNLAKRSADASKQIKELITNSDSQVKSGVSKVNSAGESLEQIVTSITQLADIIGNIANASKEQTFGLQDVTNSVTLMDSVTQDNRNLVHESSAASKQLSTLSRELNELIHFFKVDMDESKSDSY